VIWLLVGAGGAAGAMARHVVDTVVSRRAAATSVPWGTIVVNVLGSAALGALVGASVAAHGHDLLYAAAGTGFCGAFTTFSAFTWETLALAEDGLRLAAAANVALCLVLGVGVAAGFLFLL
jgi:CrcB protein